MDFYDYVLLNPFLAKLRTIEETVFVWFMALCINKMSQDLKKQVEFFSGSQGQLFCFWELTERLYPLTYEVSIIEIGKILNLVF